MKNIMTLCMICRGDRLLLGMKKRGFGAGLWNGFGGKVQSGETIEAAARRESFEESGVQLLQIHQRGLIRFRFVGEEVLIEGHIFSANEFVGQPRESEEMLPRWFGRKEIPYAQMWPGDRCWLPLLLQEKNFVGEFHFRHRSLWRYHLRQLDAGHAFTCRCQLEEDNHAEVKRKIYRRHHCWA